MKKILCVCITVICCVVIGLLCFFLGKSYTKCSNEKLGDKSQNTETIVKEEDNEEDYWRGVYLTPSVVDGIKFTYVTKKSNKKFNIKLPFVFGNTKGIRNFNHRISGNILTRINDGVGWFESVTPDDGYVCEGLNPLNYTYNSVIKNGIIVIEIYSEVNDCGIPSSGSGEWIENYFFDINNDKELTIGEAVKLLGLKDEKTAKEYDDSNSNIFPVVRINNGNLKVEEESLY